MSLWIAGVIIMILTAGGALRVRGRKMPAPLGMIVIGAVAFGFLIGSAAYVAIQNQRVHDQCVYNVARSDGNRQQWLDLATYLETRHVAGDAVAYVRAQLDVNLPQRTLGECS